MEHPLWHDDNGPIEGDEVRIGQYFTPGETDHPARYKGGALPDVYRISGIWSADPEPGYRVHGIDQRGGAERAWDVAAVRRWEPPTQLVWAVPADLHEALGELSTSKLAEAIATIDDPAMGDVLNLLVDSVWSALDRDATPEAVCTLPHETEGDDRPRPYSLSAPEQCPENLDWWECTLAEGHDGDHRRRQISGLTPGGSCRG